MKVLQSGDKSLIDAVKAGTLPVKNAAARVATAEKLAAANTEPEASKPSSAGPPPVLTHDQEFLPAQAINVRFSRKDTSNLVVEIARQFTLV